MKKNQTEKIMKYLAENPKGKIEDLNKKFDKNLVEVIKRSPEIFKVEGNSYIFTEKGFEVYANQYTPKPNFLRL